MKTVFSTQEGVKMNSNLEFGDTKDIVDEFQYLMDTIESMWDAEFKYFYRITDDNYIQLAYSLEESDLTIIAQEKLKHKNLKDNIISIVKRNIEAHLPYDGFPLFEKSSVFTEQEFNTIIQTIKDEKDAIIKQAKGNQTPLIDYLREQNLNPKPSGDNPNTWVASCPCGGNHHIMVGTLDDGWGCGYCSRGGKLPEIKKWIQEIKIKKDEKDFMRGFHSARSWQNGG